MKNKFVFLASFFGVALFSDAETVVIKSPDYFTASIRDGHELFPDSLVYSREAEEIVIPDI